MIDHVTKNSRFKINANDWNKIGDMCNFGKTELTQKFKNTKNNMVQVINRSGENYPLFGIFENFGQLNSDLNPEEEYITCTLKTPEIVNSDPTTVLNQDIGFRRILVLQQPLKPDKVGLAIYSGVAKIKIRKQTGLEESKPMYVIKINNDFTKMEVTNRQTPDKLLWHNADFTLGVVQLNADLVFPAPFVGLLKLLPDSLPNTYKIVVENVYTKQIYHIQSDTLSLDAYRQLTRIPARPRSLGVIAYYTKTEIVSGDDYAQIQTFFSNDMEGVVKFDDAQTSLNSMVFGKRSQKDIIGTRSPNSIWYGDYAL